MASINCEARATASFDAKVKRGPESWAYFYMVGGVLLAVALTVISVLDAPGWARAIWILCAAALIIAAIAAIADSARVHSLLLRIKRSYENKFR